jgi:phytoene/squalene synthetase
MPPHATGARETAAQANPAARSAVDEIAAKANENFHVLSSFVPKDLRSDFAAVYAFCRNADDIADDHPPTALAKQAALAALARWHELTDLAAAGRDSAIATTANSPLELSIFTRLSETIQRRNLPADPFHDLLAAFEIDQHQDTYETWDQLVDYSRLSANPVGRIVLMLFGYSASTSTTRDKDNPANHRAPNALWKMSDAICTGLQLANFWQDVRRDLDERERVYLPVSESGFSPGTLRTMISSPSPDQRAAYRRTLESLVLRTNLLFEEGKPIFELLTPTQRPVIWLFAAGGKGILRSIERMGYGTLWRRPRLSTLDKLWLLSRAYAIKWRDGFGS